MRAVPERDRFADLLERALAGSPDPRLTSTTALLERSGPIEWSGCGVLHHAEQDVGVVMTVRLGPRLGGLIAVGLFPAYRGRGLGRAAFATGWALLARRGMTEVVDEVLLSNHAALAILTDAGLNAEPPYLLVHPTPG
jgi:ribosomal protein S18 acetylase RimI-like enzyme